MAAGFPRLYRSDGRAIEQRRRQKAIVCGTARSFTSEGVECFRGFRLQAVLQSQPVLTESRQTPPQAAPRNFAVDTYRGFVMLLMMAEVLQLSRVARAFPGNAFWGFLAYHQTHVDWAGCSLHDTIQPGF